MPALPLHLHMPPRPLHLHMPPRPLSLHLPPRVSLHHDTSHIHDFSYTISRPQPPSLNQRTGSDSTHSDASNDDSARTAFAAPLLDFRGGGAPQVVVPRM